MAGQLKTFRGNCHCGAYIYEAKIPEDTKPSECNCSSCYKKGALWIAPKNEDIRFVKGDVNTLTNYTFGNETFNHKFCPTCGVQLMIIGHLEPPQPGEEKEPMTAVNIRSFQHGQGLDVWKEERKPIDGKSFGAPYDPPKYTGPEPKAAIEGGKLYTGSCHCGAVRVAVKSKPLDKTYPEKITECNCSICNRHGSTWFYPKTDQVKVEGKDNLTNYLFGTKLFGKHFCKTCGIVLYNRIIPITEEEISQMPEGQANFVRGSLNMMPVNLRVINGLNVKDLNVTQFDGYNSIQPRYVEP